MNLLSVFSSISRYSTEIKKYREKHTDIALMRPSLIDCIIAYIRYGCVLNHYLYGKFYKLPSSARKEVFTYRHWSKIIPMANNNDFVHFLKNKVDFNNKFKEYLHRDWLYSAEMTYDEFLSFARKHEESIIKPYNGLEGEGIYLLKITSNTDIESLFHKLNKENVIIEERIIQHPDLIFNNKSVNTIRAYTLYNKEENKVIILKTVIRAGIGESIVDNSHAGGCAYEVDLESGKISSHSYCANGLETEIHPGTNIMMIGKQIPYWNEVKQLCHDAALQLKDCRFIGWDIAITKHGPLLIEGNHTPDLDMVEFVGKHGYLHTIKHALNIK